MKSLLLSVLLLLCSKHPGYSQIGHAYGGTAAEEAYGIEPTRDGGFVIGARTNSEGAGDQDYWALKFDSTGTLQWERPFGTSRYELLWSIRTTHDDCMLLAGFSGIQYSGTESALLYKVNGAGNQVWKKEIDYARADHAHWLSEAPDGGYYFTGHTDSKTDASGDFWLVKMDSSRTVQWERTFDFGGPEHAHAATLTTDGGVCILGHENVNNFEKFRVVRVDTLGMQVWTKRFSSSTSMHDSPYFIQNTRNGGFALFGGTSNNSGNISTMWLVVIDSNGNEVFNQHYGSGETFAWSGRQTRDGGFVLAGYTNAGLPTGQYGMYVVKTDSLGTMQWQKTYNGGQSDFGNAVIEHGNNYVVVGSTSSFATGGDFDAWVVFTDLQGNVVSTLGPATAIAPVALDSLIDGAVGIPSHPRLSWHPVGGATSYQIIVSTDSTFSRLTHNWQGIRDTALTLSNLSRGTTYYWRVCAFVGVQPGPWSPRRTFRELLAAPSQVALLSPSDLVNLVTDSVTFRWRSASPAIAKYELSIADNAQFTGAIRDSSITDTLAARAIPADGNTRWWRVRAANEAGWGAFSTARTFSVSPSGVTNESGITPRTLTLKHAYPNPFRTNVAVTFSTRERMNARIELVNVLGRVVLAASDRDFAAGEHTIEYSSAQMSSLPSGEYLVVVSTSRGARVSMPVTKW